MEANLVLVSGVALGMAIAQVTGQKACRVKLDVGYVGDS